MDASAGFDVENIEEYTKQFEAIAATISEKTSSQVSLFNEFDASKIGIVSEKIKTPINLFSKSIDKFEEPITNQVKGALNGALQYAKTKVAEQNITNISLSQFVVFANEYVQNESGKDYKDVGFAVDGENESKLIVNVKLSNTTDVSGIEFNLGDIAKINAAGSRNLSSSLEFQVAIDLDKNSDGNYLDSEGDFSVEDVVVKKLNAVVKDFGGSAEFMGLTIQEQTDSEETDVDLSLSYDASLENSKVTSAADLEFALAGSETLPFEFAEGQIMKVSIVDGKFVAKVPTIQMKEGFLLAPKVSALISEDSFVNDLTLKIGDENVSIENSVSIFNELMGKAMIALKGAIKNKNIDAATLLECLRIVAGDKLTINYTGDIVGTLSIPGRKSLNGKLVNYFYTQTTIFEETNVTKEYIKEHYTLKMEKVVTGDESNPVVVSLDEYTGIDYYLSFDLGSCPDCPKGAQCSPCDGRVVAAIYSYNPRP